MKTQITINITDDYRVTGQRYGWTIQKRRQHKEGKHVGEYYWKDDQPAYPASLPQAIGMIHERLFKANGGTVSLKEAVDLHLKAVDVILQSRATVEAFGMFYQHCHEARRRMKNNEEPDKGLD